MKNAQNECDKRNKETSRKEVLAFIANSPDKYVAYAYPKRNEIGTWTGEKLGTAQFVKEWRGNMGDMRQSVYIVGVNGVKYYGVYFKSGSDLVRMRRIIS